MRKNVPRFLAWLLLLFGVAGGPAAARFGYAISPSLRQWLIASGVALMTISFFWFPRRNVNRPARRQAAARPAAKVSGKKRSEPLKPRPEREPVGEPASRTARRRSQTPKARHGKH